MQMSMSAHYKFGNISSARHILCAKLETFNQDHKMFIQGAEGREVILHITACHYDDH